MLTQQKLKSLMSYDPATGEFRWTAKRSGARHDREAGYVHQDKTAHLQYRCIEINEKQYGAHRLAWLYMTGNFPKNEIDHINRNPLDNRFANLRDVTKSINQSNTLGQRRHIGRGLPKGVYPQTSTAKFYVSVRVEKHLYYGGQFDTPEQAGIAAEKLRGKFGRALAVWE